MAIPDFQSLMLPLLKFCGDGKEHTISETVDTLADEFKLTKEERSVLLPSGHQEIFKNRVGWAKADLKMAGLLDRQRGVSKITPSGVEFLKTGPTVLNRKVLKQFPEYLTYFNQSNSGKSTAATDAVDSQGGTPDELLQSAYAKIRQALATELRQRLKSCSWQFFERLVLDVILKMGYGGLPEDAAKLVGKSGDEGIDGIIKEDKLGLDIIYIQAKQWKEATVGRPDIQKFVGALSGKQAKKGLFITSSEFSTEAREYVSHLETKVVLIDGAMLAELMIDNSVGVSVSQTFQVKKVDEDYFTQE